MQVYLDGSNDIVLGNDGNIRVTNDLSELVSQRIRCRLNTFRGELFLSPSVGVPYFDEVFKKNPNLSQIRDLLLAEVRSVDGVDSVEESSMSFDSNRRVFYLYFKCKLTDGSITEVSI